MNCRPDTSLKILHPLYDEGQMSLAEKLRIATVIADLTYYLEYLI